MRLGIMQPYLFPYIGYFQLISSVDKFIIYDDVNFIKQGWINRNRILLNNSIYVFTTPLKNASSFAWIRDTYIDERMYSIWKKNFFKTAEQAYSKSPFYESGLRLIKIVFENDPATISQLAANSVISVCKFLDIGTEIIPSSVMYNNQQLKSESRIIDLCKKVNADEYINLSGGTHLYAKENFLKEGIQLHFLNTGEIIYRQFDDHFSPFLSIIDVMMFNDKGRIQQFLKSYQLV